MVSGVTKCFGAFPLFISRRLRGGRRACGEQTPGFGMNGKIDPREAGLFPDVLEVLLNGFRRHEEFLRDLFVLKPAPDTFELDPICGETRSSASLS
jgi:hypothetical protein